MLRVGPSGSGGGGGGSVSDIVAGPGVVVVDGTGPTATVSTGPGMSNLLYVSKNGSDVTGAGSFVLPFATYAKAAAVATVDGAATGNSYAVMFAPGTYAENILLVPNVDLCGVDLAGSVYLSGNMGLLAADWAGATAFSVSVSNCRLLLVTDLNFLAAGSTVESFVDFYNCYIGANFTSEGNGNQDVYFLNCVFHSCALVASDVSLLTDHCTFYSGSNTVTITAPTFGAGWFSYGTSLRCPVTVNGGVGASCTLTGTSINSTLTLNGANATYTSTIAGVPALGVVLTGGAVIAQYTILGELPVGSFAGGAPGQTLLTSGAGASTWTTFGGDAAALSATGVLRIGSLQGGTIFITNNAGNFVWWPGASNPQISQAPNGSTGAGSGLSGELMSLTAQAGQNATGVGNNGGAGGNLVLASGVGGTSGSATPGAAGEIDLDVGTTPILKLGAAGVGLLFSSVNQPIGPASVVLTPAVYLNPVIVLTGAIAAPRTVTFPNLPGLWLVDISGVGGLSGTNTLTFASGSATTTPLTTLLTNSNLLWIKTTGANGIQINL